MTDSISAELKQRLDSIVAGSPVVLFMKGNRQQPQCGFSAQVVQILDRLLPTYETVDVLADQEIREGVKEFSDWPTIPQLYIGGEFQGGCDIVREMYANGELHQALGVERPSVDASDVTVEVSDAAVALLEQARGQYGGGDVHLGIDAAYQHSLAFGPPAPESIRLSANGIDILVDPDSAGRASGLRIDVQSGPQGQGLLIDNPNAPPQSDEQQSDEQQGDEQHGEEASEIDGIPQMSVQQLQASRSSGSELVLIDVRTAEEREAATIEGSRWLLEEREEIESLPKDTLMVVHCHHGARSQRAALELQSMGFSDVHNLAGGIDAWSLEVDRSVPRY